LYNKEHQLSNKAAGYIREKEFTSYICKRRLVSIVHKELKKLSLEEKKNSKIESDIKRQFPKEKTQTTEKHLKRH
jgi:hypothetical protein